MSNVKIAISTTESAVLVNDMPANYRVVLTNKEGVALEPVVVPLAPPCVANFDNMADGDYLGLVQCVRADGSIIEANQISFNFSVATTAPSPTTAQAQVPSSVSVIVIPNA